MTLLDGTDREILELLVRDARRPLSEIAREVSLSAPAVKRRIDRLEATGVITGFTISVDHSRLGTPLEAFCELRFVGNSRVEDIASIAQDLPEVRAVFTIAGDPDALAWIRVRDVAHLKATIDRIRRSGNIVGTKTLMVLGAWSQEPSLGTAPAA